MSLFVCEKCGCIENTALGFFWGRRVVTFKDSYLDGMALCSECAPAEFSDGTKSRYGKWHGKFTKEMFDKDTCAYDWKSFLNVDEKGNVVTTKK